jgi:hypothetical protein
LYNDVVPHQKNHLKPVKSEKPPQKPPRGVKRTISIVRMCSIPDFAVGG